MRKQRLYKSLYFQVLVGIALGVILGVVAPEYAVALKPLGDGFIKLVRMLIAPVIFTTVVVGIAQMGAMKDVGRIGIRALVVLRGGFDPCSHHWPDRREHSEAGRGRRLRSHDRRSPVCIGIHVVSAAVGTVDFILNVIPNAMVGAFAAGEILQVLLVSILFGIALLQVGPPVRPVVDFLAMISKTLFAIIGIIMRLAPIGAFGAMAFTIGRYGLGTMLSLGKLMAGVYLTCAFFIFVVLGAIAYCDRLQSAQVPEVHRRRNPDCPRDILLRNRAASHHAQVGAAGMLQISRRPCDSDRIFLQSRWKLHLHDDGCHLRGAGQRH